MNYKQVVIPVRDEQMSEILIALLADAGFEGFDEQDHVLNAYIETDKFDLDSLKDILSTQQATYVANDIAKINWNREWEAHFQPVMVGDFCRVRADFHAATTDDVKYEIIITPKMSFGTGHHSTTQLMISMMRGIDFDRKSVLDFGTGTGILAILAAKMGGAPIVAIDNDEWSYGNAVENAMKNAVDIDIMLGSLDDVPTRQFEIIIANINRNILVHYMKDLSQRTADDGVILMSGLLVEDRAVIVEVASKNGLKLIREDAANNWIALLFTRQH